MAQMPSPNRHSRQPGGSDDFAVTVENPAIRIAPLDATAEHPVVDRSVFLDPNVEASREVSIKLLREILDYQRRLNILVERADPAQSYLIAAYRKSIRVRRQLLRDLPDAPVHAEA